jgi:hypothetical protein
VVFAGDTPAAAAAQSLVSVDAEISLIENPNFEN